MSFKRFAMGFSWHQRPGTHKGNRDQWCLFLTATPGGDYLVACKQRKEGMLGCQQGRHQPDCEVDLNSCKSLRQGSAAS